MNNEFTQTGSEHIPNGDESYCCHCVSEALFPLLQPATRGRF